MTGEFTNVTRREALKKTALTTGTLLIGGAAASGTAAAGVGEGRVGHYHLNNLQGRDRDRVQDASSHNNHGTNHGATVVHDGRVGNAFEFAGKATDGDYVAIPDDASLGVETVTIAAWVNPAAAKDFEYIVDGQDHNYLLKEDDGTEKPEFGAFIDGGYHRIVANSSLETGAWTHVAGTYDGEALRVFLDGEVDATNDAPSGPIDVSSGEARIGRYLDDGAGGAYYFNGQIDDVRLYNRALSEDEIQALADMGGNDDREDQGNERGRSSQKRGGGRGSTGNGSPGR